MKSLVSTDPQKATELLRQAPQLSYAIFQALLLMGLVSADALAGVVEQTPQNNTSQQSIPAPPTVQAPTPQQHYPPPIPGQGGFTAGFPPPPPQYGTPPVHGMTYPPPPPQQYAARQQPAPAPAPPGGQDTDALVQQVLAMPQSLIDQLPPAEREQLLALRRQFGA